MAKNNIKKRKLLLSKRQIRRIIANQTNIDLAGCSKQSSEAVNIMHTSFEDSSNSDTTENINNNHTYVNSTIVDFNINNENLCSNNEYANDYEQCEMNIITQSDNDHCNSTNNINYYNSNNSTNNNIKEQFEDVLASWAVSYNVPHNAGNALLTILRKYTPYNFPLQMRSLLQTPRQTDIIKVCEGEYFHWGVDNVIQKMLAKCNEIESIDLLINIDDLPVGKSSNASLWPILCSNMMDKAVYLVGAYFGYEKPRDRNVFLQSLVNDLTRLENKGFCKNNKIIKVRLFGLICDAPAKAFVLSIKGHTGFYSCTKCTIKGTHINRRVCFPSTTLPCHLRTDELFAANSYKNFQTGYSILNNIPNFLPISHTPLDYMHLLCLGVVKKIIILWIKEGPFSVRISSRSINRISHLLTSLKGSTPKNFVRKPRSLRDVKLWKAVEFRNFLLYTGPVVLKHVLKKDIYNHFITLHVAVTILVSSSLCQDRLVNYAEALLNNFVQSFEILYGKQYISHNIHNLLHICSDVRIFGPLDNYSAFRFENFMTSIKRLLRKNEKPLQQLIRRYSEIENVHSAVSENNSNNDELYLCKYLHNDGPLSNDVYDVQSQYLQLSSKRFEINCKRNSDNCFVLKSGSCILILNIVKNRNGDIYVIGKKLKYIKNLYELPCPSDELGIKIMTTNNDHIYSYPITQLKYKIWKIPYGNDPNMFAIFPIIHEK